MNLSKFYDELGELHVPNLGTLANIAIQGTLSLYLYLQYPAGQIER